MHDSDQRFARGVGGFSTHEPFLDLILYALVLSGAVAEERNQVAMRRAALGGHVDWLYALDEGADLFRDGDIHIARDGADLLAL